MARRMSVGIGGLQSQCAALLQKVDDLEEPAEIEDAVMEFLPKEEPMRSEAIDTLARVGLPCRTPAPAMRAKYRLCNVRR